MGPDEPHWNRWRIATALLSVIIVAWALMSAAWPESVNVPSAVPSSAPTPGLTVDAIVVRVIDGDSIVCESRMRYQVRLLNCWAPETRTKDEDTKRRGLRSRAGLVALIDGRPVRVHIPGGLDLGDSLTFGRVLANVWRLDDGQPAAESLSEQMVRAGLATNTKRF